MAEQLITYISAVKYTGSNGAAVVAEIPAQTVADYSIHLVSDSGGVLVLGYDSAGPTTITAETGDWILWSNSPPWILKDDQLGGTYVKRSDLT
jgi:hypothetical protein